ncbi:MAG: PIN domain-containing protein [Thermaerobacter sp.]|jgi:hypothetical protein|nr:PIN domain-containing protein [Thermaerobacter sp.]MDA8145870.1 PIN domain-containing protein [Thermaerobacter sp.]
MADERYLVDTSTWILALRPGEDDTARRWLDQALSADSVVTHPVVKAELLAGTKTEQEFDALEPLLQALAVLNPEEQTWREAARLCFRLRRKGFSIPLLDAVLAAAAAAEGCVLVHHDRHYEKLREVAGCRTQAVPSLPPEN